MARSWQELFITGEDSPAPAEEPAEERQGFFRRLRAEPVEDARGARCRAAGQCLPDAGRRGLGAARGDADLRGRRRHHHRQDRRAPGDGGERRRPQRRRGPQPAAHGDHGRGGPRGGADDRPAPATDRDPHGGGQRHRQDHHDRQDRLAPAEGARQVGDAGRWRHLPRGGGRAAGGVGGAGGLRHRARRPGIGSWRGGVRRDRGRAGPRARRRDHATPPVASTPSST